RSRLRPTTRGNRSIRREGISRQASVPHDPGEAPGRVGPGLQSHPNRRPAAWKIASRSSSRDLVAEAFESTNITSNGPLSLASVEVCGTEFLVGTLIIQVRTMSDNRVSVARSFARPDQ